MSIVRNGIACYKTLQEVIYNVDRHLTKTEKRIDLERIIYV